MRLSTQIIQQIVGHTVAHFSGSGHKRALGRIELNNPATIFPIYDDLIGDPIPVVLRDISRETIGMSCHQALMPSSNIILSIPIPSAEELTIRCRVMRCVRTGYDEFAVAALFVVLVPLSRYSGKSQE
jgi:hypothetical protein